MDKKVYIMWAPPRSLSTAFVRMISQRGDFSLLHEPLCDIAACGEYKHINQDGGEQRVNDVASLLTYVHSLIAKGNVFIKDTCEYDYSELLDGSPYMRDAQHIFMLRDPEKVINSHNNINPSLTCDEVGYRHLANIYELARSQSIYAPIFVDADELLADPESTVQAFCADAGLDYIPDSLSWSQGHLAAWKRTQYWHMDAADSTGFASRDNNYKTRVDNDPKLQDYYKRNLPYYEYLKEQNSGSRK